MRRPFGEGFRPKSIEEKTLQREKVERLFEIPLVPAEYSEDTEKLMQMSQDELKEKFSERYRVYLELLREEKRRENKSEENLTNTDILEIRNRLIMMNNLDAHVHGIKEGEDTHLYEHQATVFEDLRDFMEGGGRSGYVELPTGAGKTVVFIELLRVLGVPALVVVPTKDLVQQTKDRINTFTDDLDAGAVYSNEKSYGSDVVVTTYASLEQTITHPEFNFDQVGVVILDEAHEALSKKRQEVVEHLKKHTLVLGFTATPEYSDTKNVGGLLDDEIHSMSLREAIKGGALAPCSAIVAKTACDISDVKITKTGDYDQEELDKKINVAARNTAVSELVNTFAGKQIIVFCASVNHARNIAYEIQTKGRAVEIIVGETQDSVEKKYQELGYEGGWKEAYAKGMIDTVLSVSLLTRGTDLPTAEVCINAAPTTSIVRATQRAGRVTRIDPENPAKHSLVIDILDVGSNTEDGVYEKKPSVLFFQVLGDATVLPSESASSDSNNSPSERSRLPSGIDSIEGIEVVVDLEEMETLLPEKEEEWTVEQYREKIKEEHSVEEWIKMTISNKMNVEINGKKLYAISTIFVVKGNPINNTSVHLELGRAIYGSDAIDEHIEEEWTVDQYRDKIKETYSAEEWVKMTLEQRKIVKIHGKKLTAIARIFGVKGDPVGSTSVHLELGRKIYGSGAMPVKEEKKEWTVEQYREKIKEKYSVEEWIKMTVKDKKVVRINGNGLLAISTIFGVKGNPVGSTSVHLELGRAIYGSGAMPVKEEKKEWTVEQYREKIKEKYSVEEWIKMTFKDKMNVEINGKKLYAISTIFGVKGDPVRSISVHLELGRAIYGSDAIDEHIEEEWTVEQYREKIKEKYSVEEWIKMNNRNKRNIKVNKKGLNAISTIFGVKGDPIQSTSVHLELGRAIYGSDLINQYIT